MPSAIYFKARLQFQSSNSICQWEVDKPLIVLGIHWWWCTEIVIVFGMCNTIVNVTDNIRYDPIFMWYSMCLDFSLFTNILHIFATVGRIGNKLFNVVHNVMLSRFSIPYYFKAKCTWKGPRKSTHIPNVHIVFFTMLHLVRFVKLTPVRWRFFTRVFSWCVLSLFCRPCFEWLFLTLFSSH